MDSDWVHYSRLTPKETLVSYTLAGLAYLSRLSSISVKLPPLVYRPSTAPFWASTPPLLWASMDVHVYSQNNVYSTIKIHPNMYFHHYKSVLSIQILLWVKYFPSFSFHYWDFINDHLLIIFRMKMWSMMDSLIYLPSHRNVFSYSSVWHPIYWPRNVDE